MYGEETIQSANLKVEAKRTLPVVVEGIRVSYWYSQYEPILLIDLGSLSGHARTIS